MNGNWLFKCELMTKEMGEFLTEAIVWLIFNFFLHHITVNTIRFRNSTYVLKHESEFEISAFISWLLPFDNEHNKPCLLDVIILFAGKKKKSYGVGFSQSRFDKQKFPGFGHGKWYQFRANNFKWTHFLALTYGHLAWSFSYRWQAMTKSHI